MTPILILNGPNLNMLGTREPEVYGATTLPQIEDRCVAFGKSLGLDVTCAQSNSEGALVDMVQAAKGTHALIILNAGAYTHTSVALRDAVSAAAVPMIELHLSNVHAREAFRHHSYLSDVALGVICGFGAKGYDLALEAAANHLAAP
ncbi:type II 3-dehydroquinate dehydratase [Nereida sp. MMG025]|uniref:type II 3-dehydroquinate dehydratase n=1 Tax=Nereida sp. MMG025 TaxID=2909981 RepID=UPI001F0307FD|nr:type II 3-dehydroquinate dehydratase [Nereida sp. MMG025]MCF6443302.1 type II 3-dehydroquinate dehydratase [Nereida sp. MMG025]